jgi:hypothetical protein
LVSNFDGAVIAGSKSDIAAVLEKFNGNFWMGVIGILQIVKRTVGRGIVGNDDFNIIGKV